MHAHWAEAEQPILPVQRTLQLYFAKHPLIGKINRVVRWDSGTICRRRSCPLLEVRDTHPTVEQAKSPQPALVRTRPPLAAVFVWVRYPRDPAGAADAREDAHGAAEWRA